MNRKRIQVLDNGNLYIKSVRISDAGHYVCKASNYFGNDTVTLSFLLDFRIISEVKIVSLLVGFATAVTFLLVALFAQFIYMLVNRWGFCCCDGYVSPKTRQIRKILESVEQYRAQQLDRLRDNYTSQVQRIRDNCAQQMDRIRDSYSSQSERFKDIREYSSLQITTICDQYSDQVKRVRDYSVQQISRVRENYLLQRNRVRKFSAHQMIKLRENYKLQQLHLNKILENLNMESCRTTCGRTDSIFFEADETLANLFPSLGPTSARNRTLHEGIEDDASRMSQYFDTDSTTEGICMREYSNKDPLLGDGKSRMVDKCVGTSLLNLTEKGKEETELLLRPLGPCYQHGGAQGDRSKDEEQQSMTDSGRTDVPNTDSQPNPRI